MHTIAIPRVKAPLGEQAIVLFLSHSHAAFCHDKLEQCDQIRVHKLSADWTTNKRRELLLVHGQVLFNLNDVKLVIAALNLNRKDVVSPFVIDTDVELEVAGKNEVIGN